MKHLTFIFVFACLILQTGCSTLAAASASSGFPVEATKHWTADNGNGTYSNPLLRGI